MRANTVRPYIFIDANELGIYAAGKRTVKYGNSTDGITFGTTQSNPIITLPGLTCNTGVGAYYNTNTSAYYYSITLPSDWGVYAGDPCRYSSGASWYDQFWHVTPPTNATAGIYKLKSGSNYIYIQVGTSTTLVWDADTAIQIRSLPL